eukprot:GHRR01013378.1.p2 GENE.GHRR01013378.1~~GHRR01013378.1.p2  ORF type:complete len:179 (+),score=45.33 GHRR01013378.1:153-689(+)
MLAAVKTLATMAASGNLFQDFAFAATVRHSKTTTRMIPSAIHQQISTSSVTASSKTLAAAPLQRSVAASTVDEKPAAGAISTAASCDDTCKATVGDGSTEVAARTAETSSVTCHLALRRPSSTLFKPSDNTRKRQRKAYSSLTGPPRGLPEKLGTAPLRFMLVCWMAKRSISSYAPCG